MMCLLEYTKRVAARLAGTQIYGATFGWCARHGIKWQVLVNASPGDKYCHAQMSTGLLIFNNIILSNLLLPQA